MVLGPIAAANGLQLSLLERLKSLYESLGGHFLQYIVKLNKVYRCHRELLEISSKLFYNSLLKPDSVPYKAADFPYVFVCSGVDRAEWSPSCDNEYEAKVVISEIKECLKKGHVPNDVCIMATNLCQVYGMLAHILLQNYISCFAWILMLVTITTRFSM